MLSAYADYGQAMIGAWTGPAVPRAQAPGYYSGLEAALIEGLKRDAAQAALPYLRQPNVTAVAYLRAKGGRQQVVPYYGTDWIVRGSPIREWFSRIADELRDERSWKTWELVGIMVLDRQRGPVFNSYALSPAIVAPLRALEREVIGAYYGDAVTAGCACVGQALGHMRRSRTARPADPQRDLERAGRAVGRAYQLFVRAGLQPRDAVQRIVSLAQTFGSLE